MNHIPGLRFHPTDDELINKYLIPRVFGLDSEVHVPIPEVEVLKHEPWDLPGIILGLDKESSKIQSNDLYWYFFYQLKIQSKDPYWYFFCRLDYKYLKSKRADRTTKCGYWKATGNDRQVRSRDTKQLISSKKTLVFHEGRVSKKVRGQGTNWVIHEYHVTPDVPNTNAYVICCLKRESKKKATGKASTSISVEGESSNQSPSDFVNHVPENTMLEGEGACPVESQADLKAVELPSEEGLSYQDLSLSNDNISDPPSHTDMERVMYAQQRQFYQDHPFSDSFNSDSLSQADLEIAYFKLSSQCPQQGPSYQRVPFSHAFNSDPPSQVDPAAVYQNLPLPNGFSNVCYGVQTQLGTINECETYSYLVEAINGDVVGLSSAQPLESVSGKSYCEDGGMSNDTNNEEVITQARENTEHVTAADLPPELSHNTQHVTATHLSPQLSHNSTEDVITTHLSPELSHNSDACMDYIEDFNELISPDLEWLIP